jgi:hypothetical protein
VGLLLFALSRLSLVNGMVFLIALGELAVNVHTRTVFAGLLVVASVIGVVTIGLLDIYYDLLQLTFLARPRLRLGLRRLLHAPSGGRPGRGGASRLPAGQALGPRRLSLATPSLRALVQTLAPSRSTGSRHASSFSRALLASRLPWWVPVFAACRRWTFVEAVSVTCTTGV